MHLLKNSYLLLLLFGLLALFTACDGQRDHRLPAEAKKWIPYQLEQADITFVSDQSQTRTLQVTYREYKKEITPKFSFSSYFQDQVEAALVDPAEGEVGITLSLQAIQKEQKLEIGRKPTFWASYWVGSTRLDNRGMEDEFLPSYTSRGRVYEEVIHLKCNGEACEKQLQEVYYAKSAGLIEFRTKDGRRWYKAD